MPKHARTQSRNLQQVHILEQMGNHLRIHPQLAGHQHKRRRLVLYFNYPIRRQCTEKSLVVFQLYLFAQGALCHYNH